VESNILPIFQLILYHFWGLISHAV
jgi:hypothetical protein